MRCPPISPDLPPGADHPLDKPDDFLLALVEFLDGETHRVGYLRRPFHREPDFGVTSVNYDFADLLARAVEPA